MLILPEVQRYGSKNSRGIPYRQSSVDTLHRFQQTPPIQGSNLQRSVDWNRLLLHENGNKNFLKVPIHLMMRSFNRVYMTFRRPIGPRVNLVTQYSKYSFQQRDMSTNFILYRILMFFLQDFVRNVLVCECFPHKKK